MTRANPELPPRFELYRDLLDTLPDSAVIINPDGNIVLVNKQTEAIFGYRREELLGKSVEILVPKRYRDNHIGSRMRYAMSPHVRPMGYGLDLYGMRKDGSEISVEISLSPLETKDGVLLSAIIRDISDRKAIENKIMRLNAELTRSNAELDQFAGVAAHDLREPLRMISSYSELLKSRLGDKLDDKSREFITYVTDGAERMQKLIAAILDYSSVGHQGIKAGLVDSNASARTVLSNLRNQINDADAKVEFTTLPTVFADPVLFVQLLQNLVSNALKFRVKDRLPIVTISTQESEHELTFAVADNGIGIGSEDIGRIFLLFQRVHSSGKFPGTGIGLATCKKIVERHGGRLWVESTTDVGTTFFFSLPKRQAI